MKLQLFFVILLILAVEGKKKKKTTTTVSPDDGDNDAQDNGSAPYEDGDSAAASSIVMRHGPRGHGGHGGHGGKGGGGHGGNGGGGNGGRNHPGGAASQADVVPHMVVMHPPPWSHQPGGVDNNMQFHHDGYRPPFTIPQFILDLNSTVKDELWEILSNCSLTKTEKLAAFDEVAADVGDAFKTQFDAFLKEVEANFTARQQNVTKALAEIQIAVPKILNLLASKDLTNDEIQKQIQDIIGALVYTQSKLTVALLTGGAKWPVGNSYGEQQSGYPGGGPGSSGPTWFHKGPSPAVMVNQVSPGAPPMPRPGWAPEGTGGPANPPAISAHNIWSPPQKGEPGRVNPGGPIRPQVMPINSAPNQ